MTIFVPFMSIARRLRPCRTDNSSSPKPKEGREVGEEEEEEKEGKEKKQEKGEEKEREKKREEDGEESTNKI